MFSGQSEPDCIAAEIVSVILKSPKNNCAEFSDIAKTQLSD